MKGPILFLFVILIKHNGLFLAVLFCGVFSYADNKIKVNSLVLSVLFNKDGSVGDLLDNAVKLMPVVKGVNYTFFI